MIEVVREVDWQWSISFRDIKGNLLPIRGNFKHIWVGEKGIKGKARYKPDFLLFDPGFKFPFIDDLCVQYKTTYSSPKSPLFDQCKNIEEN